MIKEENEVKSYYLKEFSLFDGEYDITFNILDIDLDKMAITLAINRSGKIIVSEYDLKRNSDNNLYFQYGYGIDSEKINIEDFEQIGD